MNVDMIFKRKTNLYVLFIGVTLGFQSVSKGKRTLGVREKLVDCTCVQQLSPLFSACKVDMQEMFQGGNQTGGSNRLKAKVGHATIDAKIDGVVCHDQVSVNRSQEVSEDTLTYGVSKDRYDAWSKNEQRVVPLCSDVIKQSKGELSLVNNNIHDMGRYVIVLNKESANGLNVVLKESRKKDGVNRMAHGNTFILSDTRNSNDAYSPSRQLNQEQVDNLLDRDDSIMYQSQTLHNQQVDIQELQEILGALQAVRADQEYEKSREAHYLHNERQYEAAQEADIQDYISVIQDNLSTIRAQKADIEKCSKALRDQKELIDYYAQYASECMDAYSRCREQNDNNRHKYEWRIDNQQKLMQHIVNCRCCLRSGLSCDGLQQQRYSLLQEHSVLIQQEKPFRRCFKNDFLTHLDACVNKRLQEKEKEKIIQYICDTTQEESGFSQDEDDTTAYNRVNIQKKRCNQLRKTRRTLPSSFQQSPRTL